MVSVIMLTYNREKYIARSIEAILAQTYRQFEFVIVDNWSSAQSGTIADEYALKESCRYSNMRCTKGCKWKDSAT